MYISTIFLMVSFTTQNLVISAVAVKSGTALADSTATANVTVPLEVYERYTDPTHGLCSKCAYQSVEGWCSSTCEEDPNCGSAQSTGSHHDLTSGCYFVGKTIVDGAEAQEEKTDRERSDYLWQRNYTIFADMTEASVVADGYITAFDGKNELQAFKQGEYYSDQWRLVQDESLKGKAFESITEYVTACADACNSDTQCFAFGYSYASSVSDYNECMLVHQMANSDPDCENCDPETYWLDAPGYLEEPYMFQYKTGFKCKDPNQWFGFSKSTGLSVEKIGCNKQATQEEYFDVCGYNNMFTDLSHENHGCASSLKCVETPPTPGSFIRSEFNCK